MNKYTVNITPATERMAEEAGMYIEVGTTPVWRKSVDEEEWVASVVIGEENSDFLISYSINDDGSLSHLVSPDYVEDLPAWITHSRQLKYLVQYAAQCVKEVLL